MNEEERARQDGWVPLEEWTEQGREEDSWVPAKEFNFRGQLMGRISSQTNQNKRLEQELGEVKTVIKTLADHNKQIQEHYKKQALKELKEAKAQAIEESDGTRVAEIDDAIDEINKIETEDVVTQEPDEPKVSPQMYSALQAFANSPENSAWFNKDTMATEVFGAAFRTEFANDPDADPKVLFNRARNVLVNEMPQKFKKQTKSTKTVDSDQEDTSSTQTKGKYKLSDFAPDEQQVIMAFQKQGVDPQEYMKQLAELRG